MGERSSSGCFNPFIPDICKKSAVLLKKFQKSAVLLSVFQKPASCRHQALPEGESIRGRGHDIVVLGLHGTGHGDVLPVHAVSDHGRLPAAAFRCPAGAFRMRKVGFKRKNL